MLMPDTGNAAKVWVLMTLEMNLGIICGCLSGVRPVFAVLFPSIFKSSEPTPSGPSYGYSLSTGGRRRRRPTHPDSFPFESLSDTTRIGDSKDGIKTDGTSVQLRTDPGKSFAWVDTIDEGEFDRSEVPLGAIQVKTVVMQEEEDALSAPRSGRRSITGSEEWIMEDTIEPARKI